MTENNNKNFFKDLSQNLKNINFDEIFKNLQDIKVEDLKNINYKRLYYDIRKSKYTKPSIGLISASVLFIFLLFPSFELVISSFKKAKQYKIESKDLPNKKAELEEEIRKFEEIKSLMKDINASFIKSEQEIFISKLLNRATKKSNIKITFFAPILKTDTTKLCKRSLNQINSKNFKFKRNNSNNSQKGSLQTKYYELKVSADYLDIIQFLREIQLYDVTIIPHCLEVNSQLEIITKASKKEKKDESIVIPLNDSGLPIYESDNNQIESNKNIGKVFTRIVFKIPSYVK